MRQRVVVIRGGVVYLKRRNLRGLRVRAFGFGRFRVRRCGRSVLRGCGRCEEGKYQSCAKNSIHALPDDTEVDSIKRFVVTMSAPAETIAIGCKTAGNGVS